MNDQYMFEALQRRQKMLGQQMNPYDKLGTVTQVPGDASVGGMGEGTNLDKNMMLGGTRKAPSIKTK